MLGQKNVKIKKKGGTGSQEYKHKDLQYIQRLTREQQTTNSLRAKNRLSSNSCDSHKTNLTTEETMV